MKDQIVTSTTIEKIQGQELVFLKFIGKKKLSAREANLMLKIFPRIIYNFYTVAYSLPPMNC